MIQKFTICFELDRWHFHYINSKWKQALYFLNLSDCIFVVFKNLPSLINIDPFSIVRKDTERNFPQGSLTTQLKKKTVYMCLLYIMLHNHLVSIIKIIILIYLLLQSVSKKHSLNWRKQQGKEILIMQIWNSSKGVHSKVDLIKAQPAFQYLLLDTKLNFS